MENRWVNKTIIKETVNLGWRTILKCSMSKRPRSSIYPLFSMCWVKLITIILFMYLNELIIT